MDSLSAILLAAGHGSRLAPLTDKWPKCLMPVQGRPLLDYWMASLFGCGVQPVFVNTHRHSDVVLEYLSRSAFVNWVVPFYEEKLLGTAGTLRALAPQLSEGPLVVAHADNLCLCDFRAFLRAHAERPQGCALTMMSFTTPTPQSCGILTVDSNGVVIHMDEKPNRPTGNLANAAVYVFEPEVIDFIKVNPLVSDLTRDVLPHFMGRIHVWHNEGVLRDIGTVAQLTESQYDQVPNLAWLDDAWQKRFRNSAELRDLEEYLAR